MNSDQDQLAEVWIGLLGVVPMKGSDALGDCLGASANVMAWAHDPDDFLRQSRAMFAELGLLVEESEDIEPLRNRLAQAEVEASLLELADEVANTGVPRFDSLYAFEAEDE